MTTLDKKIEEIIQRLSLNQQLLGEQYSHKRIDELKFDSRDSDYRDEAIQALKTLIEELVEEIINTSKEIYYTKGKTDIETVDKFREVDRYIEIREELRVEQAAKAKELLNGTK